MLVYQSSSLCCKNLLKSTRSSQYALVSFSPKIQHLQAHGPSPKTGKWLSASPSWGCQLPSLFHTIPHLVVPSFLAPSQHPTSGANFNIESDISVSGDRTPVYFLQGLKSPEVDVPSGTPGSRCSNDELGTFSLHLSALLSLRVGFCRKMATSNCRVTFYQFSDPTERQLLFPVKIPRISSLSQLGIPCPPLNQIPS